MGDWGNVVPKWISRRSWKTAIVGKFSMSTSPTTAASSSMSSHTNVASYRDFAIASNWALKSVQVLHHAAQKPTTSTRRSTTACASGCPASVVARER